jgi:hypothetical protein
MTTIIVESLLDPIWQIGGGIGIIVLTALMLTLALRSSEVHLTIQQKHRGTLLVLLSGLCCVLILSGGTLWFHASQASSRPVSTHEAHRSQPSLLPTPEPPPRPTPSPTSTPFPVLTPSTAQVLTTWCTAINRHDTATVWQQYSQQVQHQLLTNKTQTVHAQYQHKIVHCTVNDLNERSAVGYLMLTTVDGNGDGMERPYQLTLSVENQAWKITMISYCISDGCLDVTYSVIP